MNFIRTIAIFLFILPVGLYAQSRKSIDRSTDVMMFVNPLAGFIYSLSEKDYQGTKQLITGAAVATGTCYLLKYTISKERPDESDKHAFPSNHASLSFQSAVFLHKRYGLKFGIPAYAVSTYVSWGRIYAKKHDFWDVLTGAAIGSLSAFIFTTPFAEKHNLTFVPTLINKQYPGFYATFTF